MAKQFAHLVVLVSLLGCASDPPADTNAKSSKSPPLPTVLTVDTSEGVFEAFYPAVLFVTPTEQEVRIGASNGSDMWVAIGGLAPADLDVGSGTLPITTSPVSAGAASVSRQGASGIVESSTGTLAFNVVNGKISGQVTSATPSILSAKFSGALTVECWAEPGHIPGGQHDGGLIGDGTTTFLILDETLASPTCAGLDVWLP
jgi:hypothetical protein